MRRRLLHMSRTLLTQEEYDDILRSGSFERAMAALAAYVQQQRGRPTTGKAMTSTERGKQFRARQRNQQGSK